MSRKYVISLERLNRFCTDLFKGYGVTNEDAKIFAEALVKTEARGVKSHGVVRIKNYIDRIVSGTLDVTKDITILKETPTTALIDGNNGIGIVISKKAVEIARKKAEENGIGFVSVRRSNHFGAAGIWGLELSGDDMIGICATNSEPIVSAPTGKTRALGSNPFSITAPAKKYPHVSLDISNGVMALGKIYEYKRLGKPFPEGSWLDTNGNPTTDPNINPIPEFIMRPFGMHKGFGLTVMMEILTAILAGGEFGPQVSSVYRDIDKPNPISHFFIAIRIDYFRELNDFKATMDELIDYLHELPVQSGNSKVLYPGEKGAAVSEKKLKTGIILGEDVVNELLNMATDKGMDISNSPFEIAPDDFEEITQI
ncbi:Ldh family oxidoreductase [Alkalihalobacillus sp. BA299]|uniref:Ldh family oxidoreductase n=1 Tax=Alkalihalobacillus sp. BA299 TaxID=2815938 RepID=UPI001AD9DB8B|nr:Ldh family oxidoreductase [Alkalihalobacillus sp. BA299]